MDRKSLRMRWMSFIVLHVRHENIAADAGSLGCTDEDEAAAKALLLDKRLVLAKDARISSFMSGTVVTFLHQHFLPDSQVLAGLSPAAKERFGAVLAASVRDYAPDELPFVRCLKGGTAAVAPFGSRCGTSDFDPAPAELLFSSAVHGASQAVFHSLCDDKGATLTLTKDTDGNIYAGYTRHTWRDCSDSCVVYDPTTFVIIAANPETEPPVMLSTRRTCRLKSQFVFFPGGLVIDSLFMGSRVIPESTGQSATMIDFQPVVVEVYGV